MQAVNELLVIVRACGCQIASWDCPTRCCYELGIYTNDIQRVASIVAVRMRACVRLIHSLQHATHRASSTIYTIVHSVVWKLPAASWWIVARLVLSLDAVGIARGHDSAL